MASDEAKQAFDRVFGQYYSRAYPTDHVWLNRYLEERLVSRRFEVNDVDRLVLSWLAARSPGEWWVDRLGKPAAAMRKLFEGWVSLMPDIFDQPHDWTTSDVQLVVGLLGWAIRFAADNCWWRTVDSGDFHDPLNDPGLLAVMEPNGDRLIELAYGLQPLAEHLCPRFARQGQVYLATHLGMLAMIPDERLSQLLAGAPH